MSDDNTKRHWHGNPGDRHEHLNVWMSGGSKGPASRAAWALTPEMMAASRRDSSSSTGSASNQPAADSNNSSQPYSSVNERRRSSAGSGSGLFSNLHTQKRESTDPNMVDRRASWSEQQQKGGVFSKLWEGYTRGK
ncbi:hypothetical protein N7462_008548 [Penicillium macrosclerotiorum]|uniref:uncharacterized protein n=1 Tax=Penicillium macrosclerotiorum TaxID=303699 RepID=UPI002548261E|nr:uncharacterized protein N7462_008548 [Penicillium macrosclerotiorum]KAJ5675651.1 hypothetical protein N7462_008548 [Penicillium macrosclerotiorum]